MDRKVWLQYLTPDEAVARRKRCSALLIPISPIEWHGPHLPLGVDGLASGYVAERAAQILGATVYPILFVGTERERRPEMLRSLGLPEDAHIEGMDFPANNYKSFYFREEVFALVLRDVIGMAKANGYQVVRIVNGHGAENQLATIARLCTELDDPLGQRVIANAPSAPSGKRKAVPAAKAKKVSGGHATSDETLVMMAFEPDTVHLERLPPRSGRCGALISLSWTGRALMVFTRRITRSGGRWIRARSRTRRRAGATWRPARRRSPRRWAKS